MDSEGKNVMRTTFVSSPNIAVIKYWGKRVEKLNLPTNSSLSLTIDYEEMNTKTTLELHTEIHTPQVNLILNGKEVTLKPECPLVRVIQKARDARRELEMANLNINVIHDCKIFITSVNNFPTAAGLASSASGFSALAACLADAFELIPENNATTSVHELAILGSGSSVRSLHGGYVLWDKGKISSGKDSISKQLFNASHWDLCVLIVVVSSEQKKAGSTTGMNDTVRTSDLYSCRPLIAENRIKLITEAIRVRDFDRFAKITMMDSNTFHALCLDTFPPINYLSPISHQIITLVNNFNEIGAKQSPTLPTSDSFRAAYTFDAGPNAFLFCENQHLEELVSALYFKFGPRSDNNDINFLTGKLTDYIYKDPPFKDAYGDRLIGTVSQVIVSRVSELGTHKTALF